MTMFRPGTKILPGISVPVAIGSTVPAPPGGTTMTMSITGPVPAGAIIIVGVGARFGASNSITGVNDGTAYSSAVQNSFAATNGAMASIWYRAAPAGLASGTLFTATASTTLITVSPMMAVCYFVGSGTADVTNSANSGVATATTTPTSGSSGALTISKEIAFGMLYSYTNDAVSAATITEGSGFTRIAAPRTDANGQSSGDLAYNIVSAVTALTYLPTASKAAFEGCCVATFK